MLLNGVDVRELRHDSLRGAVAVVPQARAGRGTAGAQPGRVGASTAGCRPRAASALVGAWARTHNGRLSLTPSLRLSMQDTVLFNDSIAHNVAYGRPGASWAEVLAAAGAAKLDAAIARMPAGGCGGRVMAG